jgi:hypothetical protein
MTFRVSRALCLVLLAAPMTAVLGQESNSTDGYDSAIAAVDKKILAAEKELESAQWTLRAAGKQTSSILFGVNQAKTKVNDLKFMKALLEVGRESLMAPPKTVCGGDAVVAATLPSETAPPPGSARVGLQGRRELRGPGRRRTVAS